MKITIVGALMQQALNHLKAAHAAHKGNHLDEVVVECIGAQLMLAITMEAVANEVASAAFSGWVLERFEWIDTPLKWHVLSGHEGRKPFEAGAEPLQTVIALAAVRNTIAHPKVQDVGDEIIVRSKDGTILRNAAADKVLQDDDKIMLGTGKLYDKEFNYPNTRRLTSKAIAAIGKLSTHMKATGLDWVKLLAKQLPPDVK